MAIGQELHWRKDPARTLAEGPEVGIFMPFCARKAAEKVHTCVLPDTHPKPGGAEIPDEVYSTFPCRPGELK